MATHDSKALQEMFSCFVLMTAGARSLADLQAKLLDDLARGALPNASEIEAARQKLATITRTLDDGQAIIEKLRTQISE
jgi:hypothetical protein